jgi:hypothetical protein
MQAAQLTATQLQYSDVWRVGCELERELAAANERIKKLEEQILRAQKQKDITHKVIEQISREGATSETIEALLNAHFWGLV